MEIQLFWIVDTDILILCEAPHVPYLLLLVRCGSETLLISIEAADRATTCRVYDLVM